MMRAMVLAAGLGTRLMPLTAQRPKCLMPLGLKPLLGVWLTHLAGLGVERAVVNTHHLAPLVRGFLAEQEFFALEVRQSHEPEILGTGGGLVAARELLGKDPFLLVNADVVSAADLPALMDHQAQSGAIAVMGMTGDPRFNTVALDAEGRVLGFKGDPGLPQDARWRTYTGLAAVTPELVDLLPLEGFSSLIHGLRAAIARGALVLGMDIEAYWDDLGSAERLWTLNRDLALGKPPPGLEQLAPYSKDGLILGPEAKISPQAQVEGFCVLGEGAIIEDHAYVRDSLLLPGARVPGGVRVEEAILGDGFIANKDISGGAHA